MSHSIANWFDAKAIDLVSCIYTRLEDYPVSWPATSGGKLISSYRSLPKLTPSMAMKTEPCYPILIWNFFCWHDSSSKPTTILHSLEVAMQTERGNLKEQQFSRKLTVDLFIPAYCLSGESSWHFRHTAILRPGFGVCDRPGIKNGAEIFGAGPGKGSN